MINPHIQEIDDYVTMQDQKDKARKNRQKNKALQYIKHTMKRLRYRKGLYASELIYCNAMIEYVNKVRWLPDSYRKMLNVWNWRLDKGKGKDPKAKEYSDVLASIGL